jgi:hypothetical protein
MECPKLFSTESPMPLRHQRTLALDQMPRYLQHQERWGDSGENLWPVGYHMHGTYIHMKEYIYT